MRAIGEQLIGGGSRPGRETVAVAKDALDNVFCCRSGGAHLEGGIDSACKRHKDGAMDERFGMKREGGEEEHGEVEAKEEVRHGGGKK